MDSIKLKNGVVKKLGNNFAPLSYNWPWYGDYPQTPIIPRSEWKGLCDQIGTGPDWFFLPPTHDQNGVGQCNPEATAGALESQRLKQGLPLVMLSAGDLYDRINGGSDNGSTLEDGIRESFNGIATVEDCGGNIWRKGSWHAGTPSQRKPYRTLEVYLCPSFDACFSAVLQGFDLVSGILWYNNYTPDNDGWLPQRGTGQPGGHAVHGYKPTYRGNDYGIWHENSWGNSYGLIVNGIGGLCVFPESVYGRDIGGWWAIRSITDTGDGGLPPLSGG